MPASPNQELSSQAISSLRMVLVAVFAVCLAQFGVAQGQKRHYWPVKVAQVAQTKHTHIQVTGKVTLVKHEQDGDLHIRISDLKGHFIVGECVPELPCAAPKKGDKVRVQGISREDKEHGWFEVHPIESLEILP